MPKNKGKGGKNKKRGKNEAEDDKIELIFKEDGLEYAQVQCMLGNGRCEAMCMDGVKRLCHIRGKMHKKYMPDEARLLKAYGELPDTTRLDSGMDHEEEDGGGKEYFEFKEDEIDAI